MSPTPPSMNNRRMGQPLLLVSDCNAAIVSVYTGRMDGQTNGTIYGSGRKHKFGTIETGRLQSAIAGSGTRTPARTSSSSSTNPAPARRQSRDFVRPCCARVVFPFRFTPKISRNFRRIIACPVFAAEMPLNNSNFVTNTLVAISKFPLICNELAPNTLKQLFREYYKSLS